MAIGCTAFYKLQSKGVFKKVDYSKYPDIEFSGTYYANSMAFSCKRFSLNV